MNHVKGVGGWEKKVCEPERGNSTARGAQDSCVSNGSTRRESVPLGSRLRVPPHCMRVPREVTHRDTVQRGVQRAVDCIATGH